MQRQSDNNQPSNIRFSRVFSKVTLCAVVLAAFAWFVYADETPDEEATVKDCLKAFAKAPAALSCGLMGRPDMSITSNGQCHVEFNCYTATGNIPTSHIGSVEDMSNLLWCEESKVLTADSC